MLRETTQKIQEQTRKVIPQGEREKQHQQKGRKEKAAPRGATRTTPTKEGKPASFKRVETKAAPPKRRLSLLFFLFVFNPLSGLPPWRFPNRISTTEKESNFKQVVGLFFTSYQVFDIGRKRPRTNLIDQMFVTSGKVKGGGGGK